MAVGDPNPEKLGIDTIDRIKTNQGFKKLIGKDKWNNFWNTAWHYCSFRWSGLDRSAGHTEEMLEDQPMRRNIEEGTYDNTMLNYLRFAAGSDGTPIFQRHIVLERDLATNYASAVAFNRENTAGLNDDVREYLNHLLAVTCNDLKRKVNGVGAFEDGQDLATLQLKSDRDYKVIWCEFLQRLCQIKQLPDGGLFDGEKIARQIAGKNLLKTHKAYMGTKNYRPTTVSPSVEFFKQASKKNNELDPEKIKMGELYGSGFFQGSSINNATRTAMTVLQIDKKNYYHSDDSFFDRIVRADKKNKSGTEFLVGKPTYFYSLPYQPRTSLLPALEVNPRDYLDCDAIALLYQDPKSNECSMIRSSKNVHSNTLDEINIDGDLPVFVNTTETPRLAIPLNLPGDFLGTTDLEFRRNNNNETVARINIRINGTKKSLDADRVQDLFQGAATRQIWEKKIATGEIKIDPNNPLLKEYGIKISPDNKVTVGNSSSLNQLYSAYREIKQMEYQGKIKVNGVPTTLLVGTHLRRNHVKPDETPPPQPGPKPKNEPHLSGKPLSNAIITGNNHHSGKSPTPANEGVKSPISTKHKSSTKTKSSVPAIINKVTPHSTPLVKASANTRREYEEEQNPVIVEEPKRTRSNKHTVPVTGNQRYC